MLTEDVGWIASAWKVKVLDHSRRNGFTDSMKRQRKMSFVKTGIWNCGTVDNGLVVSKQNRRITSKKRVLCICRHNRVLQKLDTHGPARCRVKMRVYGVIHAQGCKYTKTLVIHALLCNGATYTRYTCATYAPVHASRNLCNSSPMRKHNAEPTTS